MKKAQRALFVVGIASIAMAVVGLLYNLTSLLTDFDSGDFLKEQDISHFYPAFYTMSAICVGCYIILLICGMLSFSFLTPGSSAGGSNCVCWLAAWYSVSICRTNAACSSSRR